MKKFLPIIGVVLVAALTLASGIIHGSMSDRWGPPKQLRDEAKKLGTIPDQFGNWELLASSEFDEHVVDMLECVGNTVRTYQNLETGKVVEVAIFVGPPGPTSLHTPEVCYPSRDHKTIEPRQHVAIGEGDDAKDIFWGLTFQSNELHSQLERVYYGWNPGDRWSAPEQPRFTFASKSYLYKIQLSCNLPLGTDLDKTDPARQFLKDFVPVLAECLFGQTGPPQSP